MQFATFATLALLLFAGTVVFILDSRQRRLGRQVALAVRVNAASHENPSLRRVQSHSRWDDLRRLIAYDAHTDYLLGPPYVVLIGIIVGGALFYLGRFFELPSWLYLVIGLAAGLLVVRGLFAWQRNRFATRLFRQLPDALELVTSTVRAGLPVAEAFRIVAHDMPQPTAGQFALVCDDIGFGKSAAEALEDVHHRTHVAEYGMFAVTLAVQLRSGGSLTETLQTLGDTVRQRVALAARAKALAGEVIFSARALSVSPFIVGGLLYLLNPQIEDKLFTDPTGRMLLAYAVCSVFVGGVVMFWMVRRETKP